MQNIGGRPIKYDRAQMAKEIIEWAKKPDSINLNGFCIDRDEPIDPSQVVAWSKEDGPFSQAYRIAKAFIARRRELMLSAETLHARAYERNVKVYDLFIKEEDREEIKYISDLKKEENKALDPQTMKSFDNIMGQLSSLQSELKMADINNKRDK